MYFRFNHIGLCTGQCVYTDQFAQLEALAADLKGEEKAVKGMPVDAYFTQVLSWTDVMPVIPNYYAASPNSEDSIIIDSWAEIKNPKYQLLRIANYIDEDFESVADITDTKTLTAGLIQQAEKYDCFEEPENVCRNRENNDLLYFPAGNRDHLMCIRMSIRRCRTAVLNRRGRKYSAMIIHCLILMMDHCFIKVCRAMRIRC